MTFFNAASGRQVQTSLRGLVSLLLSAFTAAHNLQPGQQCYNIEYGKVGICSMLSQCPWAEKEISYGRQPEMCSPHIYSQLVCCLTCDEHHPSSSYHEPMMVSIENKNDRPNWNAPVWPDFPQPNRPMRRPPTSGGTQLSPVSPSRPNFSPSRPSNGNLSPSRPSNGNQSPSSPSGNGRWIPGERARKMCVAYEKYVPAARYGKYAECVQNDTYPIGGNPAIGKEFPHMALLGYGKRNSLEYNCGGSLIAPTFVLTAAHCLFDGLNQPVEYVLLGDLDLTDETDDAYPQLIRVKERIRHPDYKVRVVYNDVALLRLESAPDMSTAHVRPACLHPEKKLPVEKLVLTGWGRTEFDGPKADTLMEVPLRRTMYEACRKDYEGAPVSQIPRGIDDESQLCAGKGDIRKDACQGDSGGPLQVPQDVVTCMYAVAGIVSLGQGCGQGVSGVYTRVSYFVPWIEDVVWPNGS